jgi:hypothetical protein
MMTRLQDAVGVVAPRACPLGASNTNQQGVEHYSSKHEECCPNRRTRPHSPRWPVAIPYRSGAGTSATMNSSTRIPMNQYGRIPTINAVESHGETKLPHGWPALMSRSLACHDTSVGGSGRPCGKIGTWPATCSTTCSTVHSIPMNQYGRIPTIIGINAVESHGETKLPHGWPASLSRSLACHDIVLKYNQAPGCIERQEAKNTQVPYIGRRFWEAMWQNWHMACNLYLGQIEYLIGMRGD